VLSSRNDSARGKASSRRSAVIAMAPPHVSVTIQR